MANIIRELEEIQSELQEVLNDAEVSNDFTLGWERLERWKEMTSRKIDKFVSPDEGNRLRKKELGVFSILDPYTNFVDTVKLYDSHIRVLIEDVNKNPDLLLAKAEISPDKTDDFVELDTLHPKVHEACQKLYKGKHYSEAAEKGFKVVKDRLRELTGKERPSDAFGKGGLHIKGAAAPHLDESFNQAVKFLTMAIGDFKNEKGHTSIGDIKDPIRGYEYLRLSSLAMNLLEQAEITKSDNKS